LLELSWMRLSIVDAPTTLTNTSLFVPCLFFGRLVKATPVSHHRINTRKDNHRIPKEILLQVLLDRLLPLIIMEVRRPNVVVHGAAVWKDILLMSCITDPMHLVDIPCTDSLPDMHIRMLIINIIINSSSIRPIHHLRPTMHIQEHHPS